MVFTYKAQGPGWLILRDGRPIGQIAEVDRREMDRLAWGLNQPSPVRDLAHIAEYMALIDGLSDPGEWAPEAQEILRDARAAMRRLTGDNANAHEPVPQASTEEVDLQDGWARLVQFARYAQDMTDRPDYEDDPGMVCLDGMACLITSLNAHLKLAGPQLVSAADLIAGIPISLDLHMDDEEDDDDAP